MTPDQVIVCAGFAQGLELLCDLLRASGRPVLAVEAYGHEQHRRIAAAAGIRLAPIPVDEHGARLGGRRAGPGRAPRCSRRPSVPARHGAGPGAPPGRGRLGSRNGCFIIEDDYDGEFRYDRQAVGALQALAPEHVVYAGTASKSLVPGLRLGWLVLPERLAGPVADIKYTAAG